MFTDTIHEDASNKRKQQQAAPRTVPADMTPAGKYFTDFKTLYHYQQDQRVSTQKCESESQTSAF